MIRQSNHLFLLLAEQEKKIFELKNRLSPVSEEEIKTAMTARDKMEIDYNEMRLSENRGACEIVERDGWQVDAVIPVNVLELLDK